MSDLLSSEIDLEKVLAGADEELAVRPDEPSLPPLEWAGKNLFGTGQGSIGAIVRGTFLTVIFAGLALLAYRAVLNFIFSENAGWDSVRINLRLLFTQAYPDENYTRVWVTVGVVAVLAGLSLGMTKVGPGFSFKRIATWLFSWGGLIVLGVLLREPSVLTDSNGETRFADSRGVELVRDTNNSLVYQNNDPAPSTGISALRENFGAAMGDRLGWWIIGLALLAIGAAIWFVLGDLRRRTTFVPAIPLALAGIGLLVSTTWWYRWGHYTFTEEGGFEYGPGELVATSTRIPWTIMFVLLVVAYLGGRLLARATASGPIRIGLSAAWLLAPFFTYYAILRGPIMDWAHVVSTDLPLWVLFAGLGGALLWLLTRPGLGEIGRILAVVVLAAAAFTWVGAFFGWFSMLQKVRLSVLFLGLTALLAPNFIGEARQRMKLVVGWVGFITIFHLLVTLINTASSIETPSEDFAGGFMVTIYVALFTMLFSFPLGVLLALARTSRMPLFRVMATVYIEAFRGVPLITMLFFFTVFVNIFLPGSMELSLMAAVTIAFVLFSAAYLAENVRGGMQAIRRGQYEASDALGLTTVQRTGFIVLPQALRVSIPPLVGQTIATFKETSLLAIVGVFDFLRMARDVVPAQTEFLGTRKPGLLFISAVYFIGAYAMSKYSQRLEKKLGVGER